MKNKLLGAVFVFLSLLLLFWALASLRWRMMHDSSFFLYYAFLIDKFNYIPYRDFFSENTPGVFFVNLLVLKIFGYSDLGFRCADLLYLGAILVATCCWMKKFGWQVAWGGTLLFGLLYLGYGPFISFEREYLLILPVILALLVLSSAKLKVPPKNFLVGFFFGLAAIIKPQSIIGFPVIIGFQLFNPEPAVTKKSSKPAYLYPVLRWSCLGFAVPLMAVFFYLWKNGSWSNFLEIASNYWPLYSSLTGEHQTIFGWARIKYLIKNYLHFGGEALWLAPAILGVIISRFNSDMTKEQKRQVLLLTGLALAYSLYPVPGGKFWEYHWILFYFFILQLSSLCLVEPVKAKTPVMRVLPVIILVGVFFIKIYPSVPSPHYLYERIMGRGVMMTPQGGRAEQMASFLKANLKPGDKVQALDWTGGALHAMLISRAETATPFLADFYFYHHISKEYIQKLRARFMESLKASKPRFIIQVETEKPWVSGEDTTRKFEALQAFLDSDYRVVFTGKGYFIYERHNLEDSPSVPASVQMPHSPTLPHGS